jgi:hypothetical protein
LLSFEAETEPDVVFFFTVEAAAGSLQFIFYSSFPNSLTRNPLEPDGQNASGAPAR